MLLFRMTVNIILRHRDIGFCRPLCRSDSISHLDIVKELYEYM